ncbi:alpha/beta hydrolase [Lacticaseibacillus nasuensis]|uniref:Carboxylic ester hydrolase n=1 Tax=Lacticaseibacillus nasuensis JCM 17158 TaxID=1291734 RepID=A0A0R1JJ05_9LACO|nr:alpha/beta hydrolase [Lacticaseibacillus nasuensis]KRK71067.1 carboxylic ester hydrolase [Lacticaseibacillus nasuensis JCM 17158]
MSDSLLDLPYHSDTNLTADVYLPTNSPRATIIDIHGGGWFRGDKAKDADWAQRLTAAGYAAVVPNYRIGKAGVYPAPLCDMTALVKWLRGSDLPLPTDRLAAVGGSAGGNMAVELAIAYGMPAVSLSGIFDIEAWLAAHPTVIPNAGDTSDFNQRASATINQDGANDAFYKWFVLNYLADDPTMAHNATPAYHVTTTTGPLFLANSLHEFVPTSGMMQMAAALTAKRVPFTMQLLTGTRHAKGYLDDVWPAMLLWLNGQFQ